MLVVLAAFAAALFLLTSCGGSGSNSGVAPPGVAGSTAEEAVRNAVDAFNNDPEYTTSPHLSQINAAWAYARGATGEGETILLLETGAWAAHDEFDGQLGQSPLYNAGEAGYSADLPAIRSGELNHGTWVAAMAGGRRGNDQYTHGVAFDASLHVAWDDPDFLYANTMQRALERADAVGADVINASFNFSPSVPINIIPTAADLLSLARTYAADMAQTGVPDADKKVFVIASGNSGFASPAELAGLGRFFPELTTHVLAVASVDEDGAISGFSNRCGGYDFCLVAPGESVYVPFVEGSLGVKVCPLAAPDTECYSRASGTSFAAPVVAGAFAVLEQFYRGQLGNTEIVSRMLETADKSGIYADADIYGQGLLDLDAATRPSGSVRFALDADLSGRALPLEGTRLETLGSASGDALQRAFAGAEVAALDELDAPFFFGLSDFVGPAAKVSEDRLDLLAPVHADAYGEQTAAYGVGAIRFRRTGFAGGLDTAMDRLSFHLGDGGNQGFLSLRGHPGRFFGPYASSAGSAAQREFTGRRLYSAPHLDFVAGGIAAGGSMRLPGASSLSYGVFRGNAHFRGWEASAGARNTGAMAELALPGGNLALHAGMLREAQSIGGLSPRGAMGAARGRTLFGGMLAQARLGGGWTARAAAFVGRSQAQSWSGGIVRRVGPLASSAFALGADARDTLAHGDWIELSLSQPLRIESGALDLRLPVGRTPYGEALYEERRVSLEPSARHLILRGAYWRPFDWGELGVAAGVERHAQHRRANGSNPYAQLQLRHSF